jgi:F-type H+-transporting ATPase subunit delta
VIAEPAARRYADAAHLIAREEGKPDEWLAGLQAVGVLFGDPAAQRFLEDSRVPAERKRELVERALAGADAKVLNLALLLLRRKRVALGPQIAQAYQEILDKEKGISHAVVTSAVALSQDESEAVQRKLVDLTGGAVVMRTEVDEGIIGGLVVQIGDRLIDGSTRSRLEALKRQLEGARR